MQPIPENARPDDPLWAVAFLDLAHGLVMAGAKAKIIERLTALPHSRVADTYVALRGTAPPAGPVMQGSARYFAMTGKRTSQASRIQCAIFLACFEHFGKITTTPVHRGWRLLAAFNTYLSLTDTPHLTNPIKRLDINQVYAILTHCAFLTSSAHAELQRRQCPVCSLNYPVVVSENLDIQGCPVCAIDAYWQRWPRDALSHETPPAHS